MNNKIKTFTNLNESKVPTELPISVVMIALNEERNIARAILSVQTWANEILVYDSGSSDSTCEIASKLGARVIKGEWLGFGPSKRAATLLAQNDWIFSLDCDEEVSIELSFELRENWTIFDEKKAYAIPRLSYFLNKWIRKGGWYPDMQIRFFNRKHSNWNEDLIHEKVDAMFYDQLVSNLNHYVFKDIQHQVETNNKYSSLQAQQMYKNSKSFSWFHFITKPSVKFIECYLLKLGFLDGWAGYVIARSAAYSVFLKWSKLREIEKRIG